MLARLHAYMGLILLLPLFIWVVTGVVFLLKPGYQSAYERLTVKAHPIEKTFVLPSSEKWLEARYLRTILGWHLLVRDASGEPRHLHPQTYEAWSVPILEMVKVLLNDSIAHNPERYGEIKSVERRGDTYLATTTTNVQLTLDWLTLNLSQKGTDSRFISRLYRLHYLQWTPSPILNLILALGALGLLLAMCVISLRMLVTEHTWE